MDSRAKTCFEDLYLARTSWTKSIPQDAHEFLWMFALTYRNYQKIAFVALSSTGLYFDPMWFISNWNDMEKHFWLLTRFQLMCTYMYIYTNIHISYIHNYISWIYLCTHMLVIYICIQLHIIWIWHVNYICEIYCNIMHLCIHTYIYIYIWLCDFCYFLYECAI